MKRKGQELSLPVSGHGKRIIILITLLCFAPLLFAQQDVRALATTPATERNDVSSGSLPSMAELGDDSYAWNASLDVTAVHASTTGWATLATPSAGYRFNSRFSVDAAIPIYFYRLAESRSVKPKPSAFLVNQRGEVGDLILSGHAQFLPRLFDYAVTGAITAPSGDEVYGLTTGRVTFDISNQFQRTFGRFTPNLEVGGGDSSTLVNRIVTKTYTSLGPLAHFQTGLAAQLTSRVSVEADAYEQLPLGDQKIYTSKTTNKKTTTVVTGHNVSEDNGFNAVMDATLDPHTIFSSYYSRSLRLHTDTVSIGLTYFIRSTAPIDDLTIDDLLR
jgi:hypothetical protein